MDIMFFAGGLLAGVINTLAGNGSALTVSLLLFGGMDGASANATNRIGVMSQTLTGIFSLRKSSRKNYLFLKGRNLIFPTALGSVTGGIIGSQISAEIMEWSLAVVMTGMLFALFSKKERWKGYSDSRRSLSNWKSIFYFFFIGFYGGYVQMGIGVLMLTVLVLADKWSLRDANVIKLLMAAVLSIPAGLIYMFNDMIVWKPALILAAGSSLGAWFGARYIVRIPKAQQYVRLLLIIVITGGAIQALYKAIM
ncbi:MAG: Uncharacterised protein [Owenweeksia sp. TMED14]|nr:MAG: Uncharacterised protein [Owenweeksia sp. TMED14]|tara:strand:- start:2191 stop:2946 length:756 start_codon:yes stop_codon:yes gene_type:complete